jgi:hypothetical protein
VDNVTDAVTVQDLVKEIQKAHIDPITRQLLDDGIKELFNGDIKEAKELTMTGRIFSSNDANLSEST